MKYSFIKLLRAQYSIKNDKINFYMCFCVALFVSAISIAIIIYKIPSDKFYYPGHVEALSSCALFILYQFAYLLTLYYTIKTVLMSFFCWGVSSLAKKGEPKQQLNYVEMLTWRQ